VVKWRYLLLGLVLTGRVAAEEAVARVHHAPVSVAEAHQPLRIRAEIEHPELVKRAVVVYRTPDGVLREVEFLRSSAGPYVAEIPANQLIAPSLSYDIELETTAGQRVAAFASRTEMHSVSVPEDLMDMRERALLQRLGERRSVFHGSGDWVSFGDSDARGGAESVNDSYFRIEGGYTYRPLRLITEFGVRAGVVRGTSPVPQRELQPGQDESDRYDVGMDYGGASVRFRLHDVVHLDGMLVLGATEVGFAGGGGGQLLLGDPYGTKLTLGFEAVQVFGNRFYSRLDAVVVPGVRFAPIIEVTNAPSAERYGVRLLGELALELGGGVGVAVRGGYQARNFTSGGPSAGATASYAF
jgi:hypothetical protein